MELIDNFSLLSEEELLQFAQEFLAHINESKVFSDSITFEDIDPMYGVEANEMDGSLTIHVYFDDFDYELEFEAEDLEDSPHNWDYQQSAEQAIAAQFKTSKATIAGYNVEFGVDDAPNEEVTDYEITERVTNEDDAGIGHYEFWGFEGFDSRPYEWESGSGVASCHSDVLVHFIITKQ